MSPAGPQGREAAPRRVRRVRERLLRDGAVVSRADGATRRLEPLAISPAEGEALRGWVVGEGAARTIEIGLGYGISALFVCEGLLESGGPDARHVVVDPYQARLGDCGLQVLEEAGLMPLVEHHAEESQLALPRMLGEGWRFDLAFVDGNHRFDGVFLDLAYLGRLLRRGAVVFLDDYQLPAVARAASFFLRNRAWTLEEVSPADALHQWAVLRTSRTADERPFDFYVEF
ncbi:MAG TPA: class I SAM-dependent methyltransferase [Pedococcus sp.]|nr:class I SAM-dependent methyltransferase [Pedococcus sp.]